MSDLALSLSFAYVALLQYLTVSVLRKDPFLNSSGDDRNKFDKTTYELSVSKELAVN